MGTGSAAVRAPTAPTINPPPPTTTLNSASSFQAISLVAMMGPDSHYVVGGETISIVIAGFHAMTATPSNSSKRSCEPDPTIPIPGEVLLSPVTMFDHTGTIKFDDEYHKKHSHQVGIHILKFLLATSKTTPQYNEESKTGKIILMVWSIAAVHLRTTLSSADGLLAEKYKDLERYLHSVLREPAYPLLSQPTPSWRGRLFPSVSRTVKCIQALGFGFFVHRNIQSGNHNDLEVVYSRTDKLGSLLGLSNEVIPATDSIDDKT
ncbi:hypothetical protein V8B97DRAFT_2110973 [Scleroderma yunnanense]